jgi:pimeloyl-ACP methyl ester carboxylesterase
VRPVSARAVRVEGEGPAVLLLHGVPTSGALWADVVPPLVAAGHRVIVPDLPGWGGSAPLVGAPTPSAHARWLVTLLDELGEAAPVVAGQDLGGHLALELLVRGRARAAVLTSAWGGLGWLGARLTALPLLERFFYRRYGGRLYLRRGAVPDRRAAALATFGPALADPAVVPRMKAIARGFSPGPLARLPGRARATGCPIHCIWGAADPFIPPAMARRVAAGLGAELRLLEGARHLAPFDRPAAWARALLAFLRTLGADIGG